VPVAFLHDDQRRLMTVTVTEPCSVDDILGEIDRQSGEDTWEYAVLYDLRALADASAGAVLQQMAERAKTIGAGRERGQVGIAIRALPALFVLGLMYTKLTREFVTVEVLLTAAQIDSWRTRNAPGGRGGGSDPT
jgi:hypothetical protein